MRPLRDVKYDAGDGTFAYGFPKQNRSFTIPLPADLSVNLTSTRLTAKSKGDHFVVNVTTLSPADRVTNEQTARKWLSAKVEELHKSGALRGLESRSGVGSVPYGEGYYAVFEDPDAELSGRAVGLCVFSPDKQRYFYVSAVFDGDEAEIPNSLLFMFGDLKPLKQ